MRPRKVILLIDPDPDRRGVLAYTLWIKGFRVVYEGSEADLIISADPNVSSPRVPLIRINIWHPSTAFLVDFAKILTAKHHGPKKRRQEVTA